MTATDTRPSAPRPRRAVVSRGLSVDTPTGPADEVVARRLLDGHPTAHTDVALAYSLATGGPTRAARNLAAALGVDEKTARRGIDRARAAAAKKQAATR